MNRLLRVLLLGAAASFATGAASAAGNAANIPDLSSNNMGFSADGNVFFGYPGEKYQPITNDKAHPYCGNRRMKECGFVVLPRISDTTNPVLKPWAAKQMAEYNEAVLHKGKQAYAAQSRCWPGGVPGLMLFTAQSQYYLQMPDEVTIVYARGSNVRHVYMDTAHAKTVTPNWYGESVGHYEGDTLVIDTIGLAPYRLSYVDNFRTPHSDKLHVTERYHLVEGGKFLRAEMRVEDPETFNGAWGGWLNQNVRHEPIAESENICAENNDSNYFSEDEEPVPQTKTPDF